MLLPCGNLFLRFLNFIQDTVQLLVHVHHLGFCYQVKLSLLLCFYQTLLSLQKGIFNAAFQIRVDVAASMENLCLYIGSGRRSGSSYCCLHKSPHGLRRMSGRCFGRILNHPASPVQAVHERSTHVSLPLSASPRSIHSRSY